MPTINPRIGLTLSPSLYGIVSELARLQAASRSQVLRELLIAAEPALQRAVDLMQAVERAKGTLAPDFGDSLMRAQDRIEVQLSDLLGQVQSVTAGMHTAPAGGTPAGTFPLPPAKVQAYAKNNGLGPSTPVPVNTGVRSDKPADKHSPKARV